jgi:hypothetical protein
MFPPSYVEQIGDARFPRYVMRDGIGEYWTGASWSDNPRAAELYRSHADAIADVSRYSDEIRSRDTYQLSVVIITDRDAWTVEELTNHLALCGAFHIEKNGDPRGVVVQVNWRDLHKTE